MGSIPYLPLFYVIGFECLKQCFLLLFIVEFLLTLSIIWILFKLMIISFSFCSDFHFLVVSVPLFNQKHGTFNNLY